MLRNSCVLAAVGISVGLLVSCNRPTAGPSVNRATPIPQGQASAIPSPKPTSLPRLPAPPLPIDHTPWIWFAPLPPMPTGPGRQFTGSDDFLDLFTETAPWTEAASGLQVFKLYGEWVAYHATPEELRQVVADLRRRGLALAVEVGPLEASAECGSGVESFAGVDEGRRIIQRIDQAGGTIQILALDEPYFFAHVYDGPHACQWPTEQVALGVDHYVQAMRALLPDLVIGDTEPLAGEADASAYQDWLRTFRDVNGYDLAFLHMDIDWSRPGWPEEVLAIEDFGRGFGVPVGIIYTGNPQDSTDEAWLSIAGERVKRYGQETGGRPAHILFQSWNDKPDRALPDSEPYTFTGLVRTYLLDPPSLGIRRTGPGANLAYRRPTRASIRLPGYGGELAVDGDPGTLWNSGGGPRQWIEIDLQAPRDIREIRLTVGQSPPGETTHRIWGRGPADGAEFLLLQELKGPTADSQVLVARPEAAWQDLQVLRIETLLSPSWVAWREIEVLEAGP
jgi:hypothetical protein